MSNNPFIPNSAQIPNILFDYWMDKLNGSEFKVLMAIARKTYGFGKKMDHISVKQLEQMTGLARRGITESLHSLVGYGLISKFKSLSADGDPAANKYGIHIDCSGQEIDEGVQNCEGGSANFARGVVQNRAHTKHNLQISISKDIERERKSAPARPSSSEKSKERAPNVFLSDSEHDKLIAAYAAQKTAALYRILSEWKEDTPKSKWKKNDYRSILRWVVQAESERFQKGISSSENNSALASTVIKKFSYRMDIQFSEHNGKKYMEFIKGAHSKIIYLDDIDFEEKVLKELKDRDLKMETQ